MGIRKFSGNKAIIFLVALALLVAAVYFYKGNTITTVKTDKKEDTQREITPISIKSEDVKEENFTGTTVRIHGSSILAQEAQKYVDETVAEFKTQADIAVPETRKEFGADSPSANYTIDIGAKHIESTNTESIAISVYAYTGGAHGNSAYKVITVSKENGKILSLADVIKEEEQGVFTEFVKKELMSWAPSGSTPPVVFPEEVANLKFESFQNWSLDEENLVLYFSQYEIGPGVLGPVAFSLSLTKIKDFLK